MRAIQRLRHQRTPRQFEVLRYEESDRRQIERKKRALWWTRLRRLALLALVVAAALGLRAWRTGADVRAHGYVEAPRIEQRAPVAGRVDAVHVRAGERVRAGDVLVELRPAGAPELLALEREVAVWRVKSDLAAQGGGLALPELDGRAEREWSASLEAERVEERLLEAVRALEAWEREGELDRLARESERLAHDERRAETLALLADAQHASLAAAAEVALAEEELESRARLAEQGAGPRLELARAQSRAELGSARLERERQREVELVRRAELLDARAAVLAQGESAALAAHAAKRAELEIQRKGLVAESMRWERLRSRRAALLPAEGSSPAALRALELELVAAQLAAAEARLAAERQRLAVVAVRSPCDGRLVELACGPGSNVIAGDPLAVLVDERGARLVAYVAEGDVPRVATGAACELLLPGRSEPLHARLGSAADGFRTLPDRGGSLRHTPLGLPFEVEEVEAALVPGQRLELRIRPVAN